MSDIIDIKLSQKLLNITNFQGSNLEKLKSLKKYNINDLEEFIELCKASSISEKFIEFDPSLARGLDYYT